MRDFDFVPQSTKIILQNLQNNKMGESGLCANDRLIDSAEAILVRLLCDNLEIDYDDCADFVVETNNAIYIVETKDHTKLDTEEVVMKADTAKTYCQVATDFNRKFNKKPWKYLLIPDDKINTTSSLETLIARFVQ